MRTFAAFCPPAPESEIQMLVQNIEFERSFAIFITGRHCFVAGNERLLHSRQQKGRVPFAQPGLASQSRSDQI